MKNALIKSKDWVVKHKEAIVVGAIAIGAIALQRNGLKTLNAFLDEKGLSDEYYDFAVN